MATNGKNGGELADAITAGKAQKGTGTATGQEAARRAGNENLPKGKDRGSTLKSKEPVPAADYMGKGAKNVGKQKTKAVFVGNGQVDTSKVGSPSGPVPISSVVSTPEEAAKLEAKNRKAIVEDHGRGIGRGRLTDEQIDSMNGAELRAVATDRGYGASPGHPGFGITSMSGTRGTRAAFKELQKADKNLGK